MKEQGAANAHGATNEPGAGKGQKAPAQGGICDCPGNECFRSARERANAQCEQQRVEERKKGMKGAAAAKTTTSPAAAPAGGRCSSGRCGSRPSKTRRLMRVPRRRSRIRRRCSRSKRSTRTSVRSQNRSRFRRLPSTRTIGFKEAISWQGQQYEVFRSYHPEWHDQGWYHSHYNRVELIGGGYYFWNAGYWYPAWGYSPSAQYYAYDGPIYVGHRAEPPDKVIADVQAVLQEMGYYTGEVDGLLGPLTREALTAYQADNGLTTTAVIDQPTLDSLGMG